MTVSPTARLDCTALRYICVKSTGHFRSGFEPIAGSIFNVVRRPLAFFGQCHAQSHTVPPPLHVAVVALNMVSVGQSGGSILPNLDAVDWVRLFDRKGGKVYPLDLDAELVLELASAAL